MSDTKLIQHLCDTIISYWANVPDQKSLKREDPEPEEEENENDGKNDEPQDFTEFKSRIKQIAPKSEESEREGSGDENEPKENKDNAQIGILGDGIFCSLNVVADYFDLEELFFYAFDDEMRNAAGAVAEGASTVTLSGDATDLSSVGEKRTLEDSKDEPPAKKPKTEESFWEKYKYIDYRTLGSREHPTVGYALLIFEERATNERFYEMVFWDNESGSNSIIPFGAGEEVLQKFRDGETTELDFENNCKPTKDKFTQWLSAYVKHISCGGISHTPTIKLDLSDSEDYPSFPTDELRYHFCPIKGQTTKRAQ
jgi:hypothetical protein